MKFNLTMYDPNTGHDEPIDMKPLTSMMVSSLLCSSDVIAAISIIKYDQQPKLYSIVFGEGIVNDAVAMILF